MSATIRNRLFVVGLVGCHVLAAVATDYFRWNWARLNLSPTVDRLIIASMMVALGADAGLLGVWAALSRLGPAARWFAITTCAVCWSCVYIACESRSLLDWVRYWNCVISPWHYYFLNRWCAVAGLVALVIAGVWGAIALFLHRGTQFRRLNDDQVRETDRFQFQVLDLLVLVLVVSLMLAICGNFREWFS
ncbi:MAG TPA: hypothetical protein VFW87_08115, partial [Pirellulales bacterium]|nr:hypothetical protein [Pirellulales bacterium]